MDWPSWFPRSLSRKNAQNPDHQTQRNQLQTHTQKQKALEEEEFHGVTDQLINHVKSFKPESFKNFPLQDDQETVPDDQTTTTIAPTTANVRKDLSEWQERHAVLVLSKVQELKQLRFMLCPRHMKEQEFWRIYFMLVKGYVAGYELKAIQLARLKQKATEDGNPPGAGVYEVEMTETNEAASLSCSTP